MSFKGHIFDLDGTLAHSMPIHLLAWQETLSVHGIHFPDEKFYSLGGVPTIRIVELLAEEQNLQINAQEISDAKEHRFHSKMADIVPIEAVMDIANSLRGNVPLAVATGSNRATADKLLKLLHIKDWFDAVVTADDIENPKPAPDTFLIAAEKIGVAPEHCCAYEDTDLGLESIKAAGMHAVDVRPTLPSGQPHFLTF